MAENKDYKNDQQYQKLVSQLNKLEDQLKVKMHNPEVFIDTDINAAYNSLLDMADNKKVMLHPEHLRYLARQCKQLLIIRKNLDQGGNQASQG